MFLLSTLVALLSLSSTSPPAVAWHKNFSPVERPEIQVASNNADVRVYASDRKDIEAVLYTDRKISSDAVTGRQSGNRVELEVHVPNQWTGGFSQRSVILELKIPLRSDIDIRSGNGSVIVKGTQGKLTINTAIYPWSFHAQPYSTEMRCRQSSNLRLAPCSDPDNFSVVGNYRPTLRITF
jgi:hypothetical protein